MTSPYRTWSTPPTRLQADCLRCRSRGMSPTETAEVLGITPSRVDRALQKAKEKIIGMTGLELNDFAERESIDLEAMRLIIPQAIAAEQQHQLTDCRGAYLPTPEEIAAACRQIRQRRGVVEEAVA